MFILDILAADYADVINDCGIPCIICSNSDYVSPLMVPAFKVFEKKKSVGIDRYKNSIKYSQALIKGHSVKTVDCHGEKTAVYLHGGGTTGKSKTIMLSGANINAIADKLEPLDIPGLKPGRECSLVVLPMFHAFGLAVAMHYPLTHGYTCCPCRSSPQRAQTSSCVNTISPSSSACRICSARCMRRSTSQVRISRI